MWSIEKMWSQRCDEVRYRDIINVWTMSPMHYSKFSMSRLQIWVIKLGVWKIHSFSVNIVRSLISEAQRWQIIGMRSTGISFKAIGRQMGYHYAVVSRLVRKHTQHNTMKCLPQSRRPHVTSQREERALHHLVRWMSIATSPVLKMQWLPNGRLSARTVGNRLKSAGLKSRRLIKCPILSDRHQRLPLTWCLARSDLKFM